MYFRKVLVGLDLELRELTSEDDLPAEARRLLDRALEITSAQRGELRLCAVIEGLDLTRIPASPQQVSAFSGLISERLGALAEQAGEAGVTCEAELVGGVAWVELLRQADEFSSDLLIVGAGSRPNQRGPTASKVLRFARCPVLVERTIVSAAVADSEEHEPPHVLIADDLSDVGQRALNAFVGSGLWREAKGWLVHVVEPDRWPEAWRYGLSDAEVVRRNAERCESARQGLYQHLSMTDHRTMSYGILPEVVEGAAAETLQRLIDEWQINMLVCGTASRTDESGRDFGQTAEALLPYVPCSVLAFQPAGTPV